MALHYLVSLLPDRSRKPPFFASESDKGLFSYILEIPIREKEEGQIKRIIPIPYLVKNVYYSIIPDYDYVIKYRDSYVPIDRESIKKCKTTAK